MGGGTFISFILLYRHSFIIPCSTSSTLITYLLVFCMGFCWVSALRLRFYCACGLSVGDIGILHLHNIVVISLSCEFWWSLETFKERGFWELWWITNFEGAMKAKGHNDELTHPPKMLKVSASDFILESCISHLPMHISIFDFKLKIKIKIYVLWKRLFKIIRVLVECSLILLIMLIVYFQWIYEFWCYFVTCVLWFVEYLLVLIIHFAIYICVCTLCKLQYKVS